MTGAEVAAVKTANSVLRSGPYPHYDIERLWGFIAQQNDAKVLIITSEVLSPLLDMNRCPKPSPHRPRAHSSAASSARSTALTTARAKPW